MRGGFTCQRYGFNVGADKFSLLTIENGKNKHYAPIGMDIDFPKPKISLRQAASIADSPDSWENIYSCWQLFSIFEAIQNILVKRYDLNPYFSEDLCKNIFNIRKHLIDEILNNNILEKLVKEFFNKSSGSQLRFKAMISTWDTALKANAYFQRSEENHVEKIELSLRNLRLGLSLPHDSIPTFSSEQIKKCPFDNVRKIAHI